MNIESSVSVLSLSRVVLSLLSADVELFDSSGESLKKSQAAKEKRSRADRMMAARRFIMFSPLFKLIITLLFRCEFKEISEFKAGLDLVECVGFFKQ